MARKEKVLIYIPNKVDFDVLIDKVVKLRESEGKKYRPFGKMAHTLSEVVIDALNELAQEWDAREAEKKKRKS